VEATYSYVEKTSSKRTSNQSALFIELIKQHNGVTPPTIARWIKLTLSRSGINTDLFEAHSVRGASTSSAAKASITVSEILNAADWTTDTVFKKFYYRPQRSQSFGIPVPSSEPQKK